MTTSTQVAQQHSDHAALDTNNAVSLYQRLASKLQFSQGSQHACKRVFAALPPPSKARLAASLSEAPIDPNALVASQPLQPGAQGKEKTVLYLAYGSNLCNETFRERRGIRPLSHVNVLVPSLRLTFDLPGIPYTEPCFANTALRDPDSSDYHKDRWHKGLVGTVYEVSLADYAHIIATEGGGASYRDILVDCYVLPASGSVPTTPGSAPFKAHTLFAPVVKSARRTDRTSRPDPAYAQPSARYLKLITDGAAERELPEEYQTYLRNIRPYTITTRKQEVGRVLFLAIWGPVIQVMFALSSQLQDDRGRAPKWFAAVLAVVFGGMWACYDGVFRGVFGDGERTIGEGEDDGVGKGEDEKKGWVEEKKVSDVQSKLRKSAMEGWSDGV